MFYLLVTKHAYDGRRVGQNYDAEYRASIAASRGKKFCRLQMNCTPNCGCFCSFDLMLCNLQFCDKFNNRDI